MQSTPRPHQQAGPARTRVAVFADHSLIAESVRTALVNLHFDAATVVHRPADLGLAGRLRSRRRPPRGNTPDVGVLVSDLDRSQRVSAAQALISVWQIPWLVLTGAPPGPVWGALYEQGVTLVVPSTTGLQEVCELVEELAAGETPHQVGRRRGELIGAWRTFSRDRDRMVARLATLTEREDVVLRLLCTGVAVREIAERSGVSEATVRSQVKAILRKLGVRSQIAAVAVYQGFHVDGTGRPVTCDGLV